MHVCYSITILQLLQYNILYFLDKDLNFTIFKDEYTKQKANL